MTAVAALVGMLSVSDVVDPIEQETEALRERIRIVRDRLNLAATRWGAEVGLDPSTVTKFLRRQSKDISHQKIMRLADYAGVDRGWFFVGPGKEPVLVDEITRETRRKAVVVERPAVAPVTIATEEDSDMGSVTTLRAEIESLRAELAAVKSRDYPKQHAAPPLRAVAETNTASGAVKMLGVLGGNLGERQREEVRESVNTTAGENKALNERHDLVLEGLHRFQEPKRRAREEAKAKAKAAKAEKKKTRA